MNPPVRSTCGIVLGLTLTLAACGGGSSDPDALPVFDGAPVADGAPDAPGTADANPDGPPAARQLWALANENLYRVDVATAAVTLVGPTGLTFLTVVDGAWDPVASELRIITDTYGAPKWSTIDRCTGTVTDVGPITLAGAARELEGLARDDAGAYYVSGDANGTNNYLTEVVGTLDATTRIVTPLATPLATLTNDGDQLEWGGDALYALDVDTGASTAGLYTIDRATGAATLATMTVDELRRLAWDPVAGRMLGVTSDSPRQLVEVNLTTGALTRIGDTHTAAELGGQLIDAIFFAPEPTCE